MKAMLMRFVKDEQGLESVEYAMLIALIVIGVVVAIGLLRGAIVDRFDAATAELGKTE